MENFFVKKKDDRWKTFLKKKTWQMENFFEKKKKMKDEDDFFEKKMTDGKAKTKRWASLREKKKLSAYVREEDERSSASEREILIENFVSPLFSVKATHGLSRKNAIAFDSHLA